MRLIPDWPIAWRFLSVQAAVLLALLSGLQAEVLPLVAPLFPDKYWPWISGGLALAIVVLRLIAQDDLKAEREVLSLDELEARAERVALDELMAEHPGPVNVMPAGRLERYIGAVAGIVIAAGVLALLGFLWGLTR